MSVIPDIYIIMALENSFKLSTPSLRNVRIKSIFILFCLFVAYIIYANVKAYRAFALDKKRAIQNGERIPEKNLMRLMWIGGSAGAALAMFLLRHKTLHRKFTVTVCILLFLQLMIASFILGFLGFWTFF